MMNWGDSGEGRAEGNWPLARTESVDGGAAAAAAADEGGQMEQRQRPRDRRKGS